MRLSTILGGTPVARSIRRLNAAGVHMAGTSAGAAIISEHMIAGGRSGASPRESGVVLAPGLGLTNRVIIDQVFNRAVINYIVLVKVPQRNSIRSAAVIFIDPIIVWPALIRLADMTRKVISYITDSNLVDPTV